MRPPGLAQAEGLVVGAFTADMPDNRVAGLVLGEFGYYLPDSWRALSRSRWKRMSQAHIPPLSPEVEEIIEGAEHAPCWRLP
jgi:hypothetical protein